MSHTKEYQRAYYAKNRERVLARQRAWQKKNRERNNARQRAWLAANPDKASAYRFRHRYGVDLGLVRALEFGQNGQCGICHVKSKLCLDHDHESGKPRLLLCNKCNSGLGFFLERPHLLRAAAEYIEQWERHKDADTISA